MQQQSGPHVCQIMVCVNDRQGSRQSCADGGHGPAIREALKRRVKELGWDKTRVRVARVLCLGLCGEGPNVMIMPQNIWFSKVTEADIETILDTVRPLLENDPE